MQNESRCGSIFNHFGPYISECSWRYLLRFRNIGQIVSARLKINHTNCRRKKIIASISACGENSRREFFFIYLSHFCCQTINLMFPNRKLKSKWDRIGSNRYQSAFIICRCSITPYTDVQPVRGTDDDATESPSSHFFAGYLISSWTLEEIVFIFEEIRSRLEYTSIYVYLSVPSADLKVAFLCGFKIVRNFAISQNSCASYLVARHASHDAANLLTPKTMLSCGSRRSEEVIVFLLHTFNFIRSGKNSLDEIQPKFIRNQQINISLLNAHSIFPF